MCGKLCKDVSQLTRVLIRREEVADARRSSLAAVSRRTRAVEAMEERWARRSAELETAVEVASAAQRQVIADHERTLAEKESAIAAATRRAEAAEEALQRRRAEDVAILEGSTAQALLTLVPRVRTFCLAVAAHTSAPEAARVSDRETLDAVSPAGDGGTAAATETSGWQCRTCGKHNLGVIERCIACGRHPTQTVGHKGSPTSSESDALGLRGKVSSTLAALSAIMRHMALLEEHLAVITSKLPSKRNGGTESSERSHPDPSGEIVRAAEAERTAVAKHVPPASAPPAVDAEADTVVDHGALSKTLEDLHAEDDKSRMTMGAANGNEDARVQPDGQHGAGPLASLPVTHPPESERASGSETLPHRKETTPERASSLATANVGSSGTKLLTDGGDTDETPTAGSKDSHKRKKRSKRRKEKSKRGGGAGGVGLDEPTIHECMECSSISEGFWLEDEFYCMPCWVEWDASQRDE